MKISAEAADAYQKILALGAGKMIEPLSAYEHVETILTTEIFASGEAKPPIVKTSRGKGNFIFLGHGCDASRINIRMSGSNNVLFFGAHSNASQTLLDFSGDDIRFYFGAFSTAVTMSVMIVGPGTVSIGDECLLSTRVHFSNTDGHSIYDAATRQRLNVNEDVTVEDHVWVSRDVVISKGVTLGKDCVVGQGALVTKSVEPASVAVGIPARSIQSGVTWSRMNAENLDEMEASKRHQGYLERVDALKQRIAQQHAEHRVAIVAE
jgi:carbonic anhydrase/acetyltransferase-like protein (isoleucine patch superfamily)